MEESKKKILIIEDDQTVQTVLKLVFTEAGYQVFAALDAMQGVMLAKQIKPNLIVLDIMMPAGGGFVVYERLKMISSSFPIPFLIYSSMDPSVIRKKIPEDSSVTILSKSSNITALREAAAKLIAG